MKTKTRLNNIFFAWHKNAIRWPLEIVTHITGIDLTHREARALLRFLIEVFGVDTAREICDQVENKRKCEGCGKRATREDCEGVPLCEKCYDELEEAQL